MNLISQRDAAARLGVSEKTIYRLRKDGILKSMRPGKGRARVMIMEKTLLDYMENKLWQDDKAGRGSSSTATASGMSTSTGDAVPRYLLRMRKRLRSRLGVG